MNPQFEDETPINPFDLWEGANFKLKIRKVDGYQNYDKSEFESAAPLKGDDDALESIWKSEFSLQELLQGSEFKSYDKLKERLDKVLGLSGDNTAKTTVQLVKENIAKNGTPAAKKTIEDIEPAIHEEEDDLAYFAKLAEEE